MRFVYQYRTPDNKKHEGVICAASKDAAYQALKSQGIRPGRVEDAPGLFNQIFGKGKRWLAIVLLAVVAFVATTLFVRQGREMAVSALEAQYEERSQLYGDPIVIAECESSGWTNVFSSAFDCNLAKYAVPGRFVDPKSLGRWGEPNLELVRVDPDDLVEVAKMKRMVNGMKRELASYLSDGGTAGSYIRRLDIRQRAEAAIYERTKVRARQITDLDELRSKNAELRAMGLPMVGLYSDEMNSVPVNSGPSEAHSGGAKKITSRPEVTASFQR